MLKTAKRLARGAAVAGLAPLLFSVRSGHWRSAFAWKAIDAAGEPLPWLTYPAIDFLSALDLSDASVLEFGGGQSTIWFSRRARRVVSLEDRPAWASYVRSRCSGNVLVIDSPRRPELATVRQHGPFDLILVDGMERDRASEIAAAELAADGLAVIDNADDYAGVCDPFDAAGFMRVPFYGLSPANWRKHNTAIYFRPGCRFLHHASPAAVA